MKKLILAAAMLAAGTTMVVAQNTGYNRVGISYDNTNYGYNDLMKLGGDPTGSSEARSGDGRFQHQRRGYKLHPRIQPKLQPSHVYRNRT